MRFGRRSSDNSRIDKKIRFISVYQLIDTISDDTSELISQIYLSDVKRLLRDDAVGDEVVGDGDADLFVANLEGILKILGDSDDLLLYSYICDKC